MQNWQLYSAKVVCGAGWLLEARVQNCKSWAPYVCSFNSWSVVATVGAHSVFVASIAVSCACATTSARLMVPVALVVAHPSICAVGISCCGPGYPTIYIYIHT